MSTMRERLIAENLLYTANATRPWVCSVCKSPQAEGAIGHYYQQAVPVWQHGRTLCLACVDDLCLRLEGKRSAPTVPIGHTPDLFSLTPPWEGGR